MGIVLFAFIVPAVVLAEYIVRAYRGMLPQIGAAPDRDLARELIERIGELARILKALWSRKAQDSSSLLREGDD